jgi:hypothetical protein
MNLRTIRRNDASMAGLIWDFQTGQRLSEPNANLCIRVAERDNPRHRAALARLQIENADALRAGGEAATAAWGRIQTRALAEAILLQWWNLDGDDGQPIEYSAEAAEKLLSDATLWPFRHFVEDTAGIVRGYRAEQEEAAKGN